MKGLLIWVALVLGLFMFAIATKPANSNTGVVVQSVGPTYYGNGVYYFPVYRDDFGKALAAFIGSHQDLEYVETINDDSRSCGSTRGYFVVFKTKDEN